MCYHMAQGNVAIVVIAGMALVPRTEVSRLKDSWDKKSPPFGGSSLRERQVVRGLPSRQPAGGASPVDKSTI